MELAYTFAVFTIALGCILVAWVFTAIHESGVDGGLSVIMIAVLALAFSGAAVSGVTAINKIDHQRQLIEIETENEVRRVEGLRNAWRSCVDQAKEYIEQARLRKKEFNQEMGE